MHPYQANMMRFHRVTLLLILPFLGPLQADARLETLLAMPAKKMASYTFDPKSSLLSRVAIAPGFVHEYLTRMDNDPSYRPYLPKPEEMDLMARYLKMLPPLYHEALRERLLGIYFIENLQGSGLTDFVLDHTTNFFVFMVINPAVLSRDLTEQFTYRERTCFRPAAPFGVRVEFGTWENGLLYILLHESTHAVDYIHQISPYVHESSLRYLRPPLQETVSTWGIWKTYGVPTAPNLFPGRDQVTFYGFNKGPKIDMKDAPTLYRGLTNSPFASLYGSQNWAEDLAELLTFHVLNTKVVATYRIVFSSNGLPLETFEPMRSPKVHARLAAMARLLE